MSPDEILQRAAFALSTRRPQEAERLAREVLKTSGRHVGALHVLGYALVAQGRFDDAIALLEPIVRGQHDAEFETQLAIALHGAGRQQDALLRLQRAVKRKPPYVRAFIELGALQIASGQCDDAIATLNRGIAIAPMNLDLLHRLGLASLMVRDFSGAKAAFARMLGFAPESPDALYGLARSHQELGERRAAIAFFRRHLAARPQHWAAWLSLGHCLLEAGERNAGYDCFRTAARGDPAGAGHVLSSLVKAARGKFWLKPSVAKQFLRGGKD